jgi:3-oxoisoapionate kinase
VTAVELLLTFYGDDFTGSADAMEALALGGVTTALFLEPPRAEQLAGRFDHLRALGVAGVSRTMSPEEMDRELPPIFEALRQLGAPLVHYKVCSTFDSSPAVGSIGRAIDIGCEVLKPPFVPLAVGVPVLKRFVVFGNHFATVGDQTFRLDRHPSMSRHPVTPMHESDLRRHLGEQTEKANGLIDVRHLAEGQKAVTARLEQLLAEGNEVVLFDTLDDGHLRTVGDTIWAQRGERPLLLIGSSGVEYALAACWLALGVVHPPAPFTAPGEVDQLLVMSGSAARETAVQIGWARTNGFQTLHLDSPALIDPATTDAVQEKTIARALEYLAAGPSLILFTAEGPDDPAIAATRERARLLGLDPDSTGRRLAQAQGQILRAILQQSPVSRVCTVGGDTCGHANRQLGIFALEILMPLAPAAPLCRASAEDARFDGLEIAMKGGQIGEADYFRAVQRGRL